MTDRDLIKACLEQFTLINRLALANGPIKKNGTAKVSKYEAISDECSAAVSALERHVADWQLTP